MPGMRIDNATAIRPMAFILFYYSSKLFLYHGKHFMHMPSISAAENKNFHGSNSHSSFLTKNN